MHMHGVRYVWVVALALALTGCGVLGLGSADGNTALNLGNNPQTVAEAFLDAWNETNLDDMYSRISVRSQQLYSAQDFSGFFESVSLQVGLEELTYTIHSVEEQGTSAVVAYDLTLETAQFGTIEDTGRKLRLVKDDTQWRVAWSTMDIFEGYTEEAALRVDTVPMARGNIYDRDGDVLVNDNGTISVVYVQQQNMFDVAACERFLASLMLTRIDRIRVLFANYLPETPFYIGEIDQTTEQQYAGQLAELCGASRESGNIITRSGRSYLGHGAAAHVTGYVAPVPQDDRAKWIALGYRDSDLVGLAGIESAYESQLAGSPPRVLRLVEPGGITLREMGRTEAVQPQPVYLTIDRELQFAATQALIDAYNYAINNWASPDISPGTGAVVIDVNTGAILAMASYPTYPPGLFDPESYAPDRGQLLADISPGLVNRATQERFSPGSVFKIVTTAAAVNEGLTQPGENFFCDLTWDGSTRFGDTFSPRLDWRATDGMDAAGNITPSQALTSSCDPFFYEFSARLYLEVSPDAIVRYSNMMGLGGTTNLGIYPEAPGVVPMPGRVEDAINNGIGQGDTQLTVLQTAKMVAAVANGGTVYEPYIVERVGDQQVGQPTVAGVLDITPEALAVVQRGMCDVTTDPELGTARLSFSENEVLPTYAVCGKTGTAQTFTFPNAWFVAYAPAQNPQVAVVVGAQNSREGSEVAAPMARRILDAYFNAPVAPYPEWWEDDYVPLAVPENGVAGG